MPIFLVECTAQVRRFYRVEADTADAAEEAIQEMSFSEEEDINEEIDSVTKLEDEKL